MAPSALVNSRSGNNIMKGVAFFLPPPLVPPVSRSLALALEPSHIHYPRCKRKRTVKMVAAIPPRPSPDTTRGVAPIQSVATSYFLGMERVKRKYPHMIIY